MKLEEIVKNLITKHKISTQAELVDKLEGANQSVTQSNLSRVLKKINAVKKVDENGRDCYVIEKELIKLTNPISSLILSIEDNNSNLIVRTYSGAAGLIGQIIDDVKSEDVIGVVAGDNTIIVIPKNVVRIKTLKNELIKLLNR